MQTCIMGARLLVHESVAEEVTEKFVAKARKIRCGPPTDMGTQMGPVISGPQLAKVRQTRTTHSLPIHYYISRVG